MSAFSTYQKFFSPEQAQPITAILEENGIPYELTRSKTLVDTVIAGDTSFNNLYELKIPPSQFERVNRLLQNEITVDLDEVGSDYYLLSFSDEELVDIIHKPDEWSAQDVSIAKQLLKERGIEYTAAELTEIEHKRLHTLARPEKVHKRLLALGYGAVLIFAPVSVFIGLGIWQSKKTLPNGEKVYVYDESSRQHGRVIVVIAVVMIAVALLSVLATGNRYPFY